eukprot:3698745-Rhodomonas_salina.1
MSGTDLAYAATRCGGVPSRVRIAPSKRCVFALGFSEGSLFTGVPVKGEGSSVGTNLSAVHTSWYHGPQYCRSTARTRTTCRCWWTFVARRSTSR